MARSERQGSNILHPHMHGHDSVPQTLADKRIPPFDQVYNRNAGEAARAIAQCIDDINECVDELRDMTGQF